MNAVRAIIWKETRSFLRKKLQLGIIVLTPLFLGVLLPLRFPLPFRGAVFLASAMVVVYIGVYFFSWTSFQEEQLNKTISNLLASPIRVSEFFLGKILAIFIFTYFLELVALVIFGFIMWFRLGEFPSASAVLGALVTIPIWGIVLAELLGLAHILLGNPIIIRLVVLILVLLGMNTLIEPALASKIAIFISSPIIPTASGIGVALLLYILMGRISKERMRKI